jgi:signal peptidase II
MIVFYATTILAFSTSLCVGVVLEQLLTERVAIIGSFAGLLLSYNTGVAFGVEIPEPWQSLLIASALLLIGYTAWKERRGILKNIGFGLIIGGALANIADRLPDGRVTDFFQVGTFPIFNVADSCVTVGVVLLLIQTVLPSKGNQY